MIHALAFDEKTWLPDGRTMRRAQLVPTAALPVSTACAVANALSARFRELLACDVPLEVIEPLALHGDQLRALVVDARILRVKGDVLDAFVIVRRRDERELARVAFGAVARGDDSPLSSLEAWAAQRLTHAAALGCAPLCGRIDGVFEESPQRAIAECSEYFEMRTLAPMRAAVGIAIPQPPPAPARLLGLAGLHAVPLQARAVVALGERPLGDVANLACGSIVPLNRAPGEATLQIDGHVVARGCAGVEGSRFAFRVQRHDMGSRQ